tara:strand:- start:526 stop:738 length:213 start_codon:yes stop_codon:yes gene_type:complete
MKLQEFLNKLSLASCPHGRTRGPYVQLCQHLEKLHAEIQKNPRFADALAEEKHYEILKQESAKAFDAPTK